MNDSLVDVLSCNDKYFKIMSVTIISLFEKNKDFKEIVVYCLVHKVKEKYKKELTKISNDYNRKIVFIDIDNYCERYRFWEKNEDSRYVRLILQHMIEEDKILYLDCDVLIYNSIRKLWEYDISNYNQYICC